MENSHHKAFSNDCTPSFLFFRVIEFYLLRVLASTFDFIHINSLICQKLFALSSSVVPRRKKKALLLLGRKIILCIHGMDEQSLLMKYYFPAMNREGRF